MIRLRRPLIAQLLEMIDPTPRPPALADLAATIARMYAHRPDNAARMIGTLAGNALRINLREGYRVIR